MYSLLKWSLFRGHVSFQGCIVCFLRLSQKIRSELTKLLRACEEVPVPQKWARDAQEFFFVGTLLGLEEDIIPGLVGRWLRIPHLKTPFISHEWKVKGAYNPHVLGHDFGFLIPEISLRCKARWHCS